MATHVIKKYANRKLYDLNDRRYVNLAIIEELLEAGETVQILDQVSGDDITVELLGLSAVDNSAAGAASSRLEPDLGGTSIWSPPLPLPLQLPLQIAQGVIRRAVEASGLAERLIESSMRRAGEGGRREVESLRRQIRALEDELRAVRGGKE